MAGSFLLLMAFMLGVAGQVRAKEVITGLRTWKFTDGSELRAGLRTAKDDSAVALVVTKTTSCVPRSPARSLARTRPTMVPASLPVPVFSAIPFALIASRMAPRATAETSCPAAASFAARCPPIAPAPNTQIRIEKGILTDIAVGVLSAPLDSSMSSRWTERQFPALSSWWCRQ